MPRTSRIGTAQPSSTTTTSTLTSACASALETAARNQSSRDSQTGTTIDTIGSVRMRVLGRRLDPVPLRLREEPCERVLEGALDAPARRFGQEAGVGDELGAILRAQRICGLPRRPVVQLGDCR